MLPGFISMTTEHMKAKRFWLQGPWVPCRADVPPLPPASPAGALTSNAVDDGFLGFLDPQLELVQLRPQPVATMVKHQRELEVTHGVQRLCFLIQSLKGHWETSNK